MSRFKIGQRVVAVRTHSMGDYIKGNVYIVDGFSCCESCGTPSIYLKGHNEDWEMICPCGFESTMGRENYLESSFAPLSNIADAIEYRMSVSIPELTEQKVEQLN